MRRRYWNEKIEKKLGTPELDALRLRRLKKALIYFKENSPFYRRRFKEAGFDPERIKSLEDIKYLPPFTKDDIRMSQAESMERYGHPYGIHLTIKPREIALLSATSGTTGEPTFYVFGKEDIKVWCEVRARALWRVGLRPGDTLMIAFGLGMFVGGVPNVIAAQHFGLVTVPVGAEGGSTKVLSFARLTRPKALMGTPSLAKILVERAPEVVGKKVGELGIKKLILGGEPGAGVKEVRGFLSREFDAEIYDLQGPNVSCHLPDYAGMHRVGDDYYLHELVDPVTKEPIPLEDGAEGEVLVTHLFRASAPFVRYAPGDIHRVFISPCSCGFSGFRTMIVGRTDDMLKVKGVIIYPSTVQGIVASLGTRLTGEFRIVLKSPPPRVDGTLNLQVEAAPDVPAEKWELIAREVEEKFKEKTGIRPMVKIVSAGTFPRTEHKKEFFIREYAK